MKPRVNLVRSTVGVALLGAAVAVADSLPSDTPTLEVVLVTATKRADSVAVQEIPMAITAISGDKLDAMQVGDLTDVGYLAPNVQMRDVGTFGGFANFIIRGVGINTSTRSVDPAVGLFVDGIYVGYGSNSVQNNFDIGSIEILRGPQGTLFGRNVTGGAVVVNTRRPGQEFGGNVKVTAGTADRLDVEAAVDVPLIDDKLLTRVAVMRKGRDGYYRNLENGLTKAEVDLAAIRPTVVYTPTDNLELTLIGEYVRDKGGASPSQNVIDPIRPKPAQTVFGYTPPPADSYVLRHNRQGGIDSEISQLVGQIHWEFGPGAFTSISGYREVRWDSDTDFDGTPYPIFEFPDNKESQHQFNQELRYAANVADKFNFVIGANYFEQKFLVGERRLLLTTTNLAGRTRMSSTNEGVFGEISYQATEKLELTVGGRYTKEDKDIEFSPVGVCSLDFKTCSTIFKRSADADDFSPKLAVAYSVDPSIRLYATWASGFRSTTFNSRAQRRETLGPVDPEEVSAYEIGAKTEWLDGRLRANLAAFYSEYNDMQLFVNSQFALPGLPPTNEQVLTNIGSAEITGVEAEISFQVTPSLRLEASAGYVDPQFGSFDFNQTFGVDVNFNGVIDDTDAKLAEKLEFVRTPKFEYDMGVVYEGQIGDFGVLGRVNYSWQDELYYNFANTPQSYLGAFGLLDASVTFALPLVGVELALFGKNLLDEHYYDFREEVGLYTGEWGGAPRTWGVSAAIRF